MISDQEALGVQHFLKNPIFLLGIQQMLKPLRYCWCSQDHLKWTASDRCVFQKEQITNSFVKVFFACWCPSKKGHIAFSSKDYWLHFLLTKDFRNSGEEHHHKCQCLHFICTKYCRITSFPLMLFCIRNWGHNGESTSREEISLLR